MIISVSDSIDVVPYYSMIQSSLRDLCNDLVFRVNSLSPPDLHRPMNTRKHFESVFFTSITTNEALQW